LSPEIPNEEADTVNRVAGNRLLIVMVRITIILRGLRRLARRNDKGYRGTDETLQIPRRRYGNKC
jgi:hypothetical protein